MSTDAEARDDGSVGDADEVFAEFDEDYIAELDQRWAEIRTGAVQGQDAFEAMADLRARRNSSAD